MSDLDILTKAREKLTRGWCQQRHAQLSDGDCTFSEDPEAVAWCISGAVMAAGGLVFGSAHNLISDSLAPDGENGEYRPSVTHWNDQIGRTQADVLELMDRVIAKVRHE